jgi:hypothetical protein
MLPLITDMMKDRSKGKLGSIGKCKFQTVKDFLSKQNYKQKESNIKLEKNQIIVAIGDIHADFLVLLGVLYLMDIIDKKGYWIGGNTKVVFCGDLLDRYGRGNSVETNNMREEVDIIQYLHSLNIESGGNIIWILGNHDLVRVLPLNGLKDVYKRYIGNQIEGWGEDEEILFTSGGKMAEYIAYNSYLMVKIEEFVFMHGGLNIETIKKIYRDLHIIEPKNFIEKVNREIFLELMGKNKVNKNITELTFIRDFSNTKINKENDKKCKEEMSKIFPLLGMDWYKGSFVVGHSIQEYGVPFYCDGRVWRIDLGMSEAFGSNKEKIIGGIKIFQHKNEPFEVLVKINYSKRDINNYMLYMNGKYKKEKEEVLVAKWKRYLNIS